MKENYRKAYVPYHVLLKQHEEAQKLKEVLEEKIAGTVKWFSLRCHYGFIARDDGAGDVFVHQMNIAKSRMHRVYLRSLAHNEKVEFDVVEGIRGLEASNVTGPDGTNVQGVYVIELRYPSRSNFVNRRRRNTSHNQGDTSPQTGNRRNRRRRRSGTKEENAQSDGDNDENKAPNPVNRRRKGSKNAQCDKENDEMAVSHPGNRGSGVKNSAQSDGEKKASRPQNRGSRRRSGAKNGGAQSDEENGEKKASRPQNRRNRRRKGAKNGGQSDEENKASEPKKAESDGGADENKSSEPKDVQSDGEADKNKTPQSESAQK